jgi:hypothetical protein
VVIVSFIRIQARGAYALKGVYADVGIIETGIHASGNVTAA